MRRRTLLRSAKNPIGNSDADKVVAATAGVDNWKTWAGRSHGTGDFEILDLWRGMKNSLNSFLATPPPPGSTCPVCFCEPDEWFVTSSCSHIVCLDCLQAYAANQVRDKEQHGPLKCPVCPQVLRPGDAIVALGDDKELIQLWDSKMLEQLLRALPAFRPCPKCSKDKFSTGGIGGGGFVTPECLSTHYEERRETAIRWLNGVYPMAFGLFITYMLSAVSISYYPSKSASVDLFFMFALLYPLVKLSRLAWHGLANLARRSFFKPITVECPCCNEPFVLPSETKHLEDNETTRWMDANTRRCPSCSVPISKSGGCNHMRCSHCNASFCWACMKLRTNCGAYNCRHGAPYRNALPPGMNTEGLQEIDSVLATIDRVLNGHRPELKIYDVMIIFIALFGRDLVPIKTQIGELVEWVVLIFLAQYGIRDRLRRRRERHHPANRFAEERNLRGRQVNFMRVNEQEMIAEAIRRSMQEQ